MVLDCTKQIGVVDAVRQKNPTFSNISFCSLNRLLVVLRLVVLLLFLTWRIQTPNEDALWLWGMSIVCECWFAFSWLLDILPKMNPVNRQTDLAALRDKFETPSPSNHRQGPTNKTHEIESHHYHQACHQIPPKGGITTMTKKSKCHH